LSRILNWKQLPSYKICYKYEDIPLRTYLTVAENGTYGLLVKEGKFSDDELREQWDSIVEANSELTGQMEYSTYKDLLISYGQLLAQYNVDKGQIMKLCFQVDTETIEDLQSKGYVIQTKGDVTKQMELYNQALVSGELNDMLIVDIQKQITAINSAAYADSLTNALTRSNNLVTRIEMKTKEMERFAKIEGFGKKVTYEELMANLNTALGFCVQDNITLAAFNEYQRILKKHNQKPSKSQDL